MAPLFDCHGSSTATCRLPNERATGLFIRATGDQIGFEIKLADDKQLGLFGDGQVPEYETGNRRVSRPAEIDLFNRSLRVGGL